MIMLSGRTPEGARQKQIFCLNDKIIERKIDLTFKEDDIVKLINLLVIKNNNEKRAITG
jgi:hypothetical protein